MIKSTVVVGSIFEEACARATPFRFSDIVASAMRTLGQHCGSDSRYRKIVRLIRLEIKHREVRSSRKLCLEQIMMFNLTEMPIVSVDLYPVGLASKPGSRMNPFLITVGKLKSSADHISRCRPHSVLRHMQDYLKLHAGQMASDDEIVWDFILRTRDSLR